MDGIAEAIELIAQMAKTELKTTVLDAPLERKGVYYVVGPDGKAAKTVADPAWHTEKLGTPDELVRFVQASAGGKSAVFYGETGITFVYDLEDRRNVARCDLIQSPQYQWLCKPTPQLRQSEFIRLLRIDLRGCLLDDSSLLSIVRNLKFSTATDGAANIQHGRESVGRSLQAQVTGESAIPEEVRLLVPVFENHSLQVPIACAVEVFPQEQLLKLTPYPLQVRRAMDETLSSIAAMFSDDDMPPVYRGQP